MMRAYFEAEMRRLLDSAAEFARNYPEQASHLNINDVNDRDPYIERLLEGSAYLAAVLKKRIDDDIPDISETLLQHLWPDFLKPFASATIMQITPRPGQAGHGIMVPEGTWIESHEVGPERTRCRFVTTHSITVNPARVVSASVSEGGDGLFHIDIDLTLDGGAIQNAWTNDRLTLYIHAERSMQNWLLYTLTRGVKSVQVIDRSRGVILGSGGQEMVRISKEVFDGTLNECSRRNFIGDHLLSEYFCFRDKFFFVDIHGIGDIQVDDTDTIRIRVNTACQPPANHRINVETFRLNCVPAVNRWKSYSEPIHVTQRNYEYPVVADVSRRESLKCSHVVSVSAQEIETGDVVTLVEMAESSPEATDAGIFYERKHGGEADHEASFITISGHQLRPVVLSCEIMVTNHEYPRKYLREKSIRFATQDLPGNLTVQNITRPSHYRKRPDRMDFRWLLVNRLSLNNRGIHDLDGLRGILNLYNWSHEKHNKRKVDALRDMHVKWVNRVRRGSIYRGRIVELIVNEDGYSSNEDIYLFGMIIHRYLSLCGDINSFVDLDIRAYPSGASFVFTDDIPGGD